LISIDLGGHTGGPSLARVEPQSESEEFRHDTLDCDTSGRRRDEAPALKGKQFLSDWEGKPLRSLFGRLISTMPSDDPGSLSEQETVDVVAYLLQENGYPAGKKPLGPPDALNKIQFVAAK
jgi:polar amino acid transport system substrate-binding protein